MATIVKKPSSKKKSGSKKLSEKQMRANRANAKQSTGRKPAKGKRRSTVNSIENAMLTLKACLKEDDLASSKDAEIQLRAELKPQDAHEELLVDKIIDIARELILFQAIAGLIMEQSHELTGNTPGKNVNGDGNEDQTERDYSSELDQFIKGCGPKMNGYMNSIDKAFNQSLQQLRKAQADRRKRDAAKRKKK